MRDVFNNLIGAAFVLGILITLAKCEIDTNENREHRKEIEAIYKFKLDSLRELK